MVYPAVCVPVVVVYPAVCTRGGGSGPGLVPLLAYWLEVTAVSGLVFTASMARFTENNAKPSGIDLADLSKSGPS